jgi:hypothetical protein
MIGITIISILIFALVFFIFREVRNNLYPKYVVGDLITIDSHQERWEENSWNTYEIMEIGLKAYRVRNIENGYEATKSFDVVHSIYYKVKNKKPTLKAIN